MPANGSDGRAQRGRGSSKPDPQFPLKACLFFSLADGACMSLRTPPVASGPTYGTPSPDSTSTGWRSGSAGEKRLGELQPPQPLSECAAPVGRGIPQVREGPPSDPAW